MIPESVKNNFDTLQLASANEDLCVVECVNNETQAPAYVICTAHMENGEVILQPIAEMIQGNPYDKYTHV